MVGTGNVQDIRRQLSPSGSSFPRPILHMTLAIQPSTLIFPKDFYSFDLQGLPTEGVTSHGVHSFFTDEKPQLTSTLMAFYNSQ